MAKKKQNKKDADLDKDLFDIELPYDDYEEENLSHLMGTMVDASNAQAQIAFDLTRLIIEKKTGEVDPEEVFAVFKKACKVVAEHQPLKGFWEHLN